MTYQTPEYHSSVCLSGVNTHERYQRTTVVLQKLMGEHEGVKTYFLFSLDCQSKQASWKGKKAEFVPPHGNEVSLLLAASTPSSRVIRSNRPCPFFPAGLSSLDRL